MSRQLKAALFLARERESWKNARQEKGVGISRHRQVQLCSETSLRTHVCYCSLQEQAEDLVCLFSPISVSVGAHKAWWHLQIFFSQSARALLRSPRLCGSPLAPLRFLLLLTRAWFFLHKIIFNSYEPFHANSAPGCHLFLGKMQIWIQPQRPWRKTNPIRSSLSLEEKRKSLHTPFHLNHTPWPPVWEGMFPILKSEKTNSAKLMMTPGLWDRRSLKFQSPCVFHGCMWVLLDGSKEILVAFLGYVY